MTSVAVSRVPASSLAVSVTVRAPPFSDTRAGRALSAIAVDAVSSSRIVSVALPSARPVPDALALSTTVSSPSATLSSVGVKASVRVRLVWLAGMVSVKPLTAA